MNSVKELRRRSGTQQKELAILAGVSQATVSDWELGKKDPAKDNLTKLCEIFNTTPSVIFGYEPVASPTKSKDIRMPSDEELKFALFKGTEGITEQDFEDVKKFAEFVVAKRKGILS